MTRRPAPDKPTDTHGKRGIPLPVASAEPARPSEPPPAAVRRPRRRSSATSSATPPPVVGFVSLGCAKNLVDSERMLGDIATSGAILTGDDSAADVVVVNTCGFLGAAREEALGVLRELAARKRAGDLRHIVVAGCLVQRDGEAVRDAVPEVDALVGVNDRAALADVVWRLQRDEIVAPRIEPRHATTWSDRGRLRLTPPHYAYVRISEGCNQKCTFCTIPRIRGPMRSKPAAELVKECRELIADGARELILIGQDTTSYGRDCPDGPGLAELLRTLDGACDGADWLRLMYVYPAVLTDEMIAAVAECERVVKYIDIPLQHVSDRVLRAMGRRVTRARTEALLAKLRRQIPGVAIRTTFIVGFPGETDAEFEELLAFVRTAGFEAVGTFSYSAEEGTPAVRLPNPVKPGRIAERHARLMALQQEVAFQATRARVGTEVAVLVDERDAAGHVVGRHAQQAPEVDGVCRFARGRPQPGHLVRARVVDAAGYDLVVTKVNAQAEAQADTKAGVKTAVRKGAKTGVKRTAKARR